MRGPLTRSRARARRRYPLGSRLHAIRASLFSSTSFPSLFPSLLLLFNWKGEGPVLFRSHESGSVTDRWRGFTARWNAMGFVSRRNNNKQKETERAMKHERMAVKTETLKIITKPPCAVLLLFRRNLRFLFFLFLTYYAFWRQHYGFPATRESVATKPTFARRHGVTCPPCGKFGRQCIASHI